MIGAQLRIAADLRSQQITRDRNLVRDLRQGNGGSIVRDLALARVLELLVDRWISKSR